MAEMIEGDELAEFLISGTRTAKIGCVKKDGSSIVSPIWFTVDENDIIFTTMNTTLKYKIISRDSRVSISVDDESFPYSFALIQGLASIHVLSVSELLPWTTKIAGRYVPDSLSAKFGERNAVEGEVLIRIKPVKILAYRGVAD